MKLFLVGWMAINWFSSQVPSLFSIIIRNIKIILSLFTPIERKQHLEVRNGKFCLSISNTNWNLFYETAKWYHSYLPSISFIFHIHKCKAPHFFYQVSQTNKYIQSHSLIAKPSTYIWNFYNRFTCLKILYALLNSDIIC